MLTDQCKSETMKAMGRKWAWGILDAINDGDNTYVSIKDRLKGVSDKQLSQTLKVMAIWGILKKGDGYHMTKMGSKIYSAVNEKCD